MIKKIAIVGLIGLSSLFAATAANNSNCLFSPTDFQINNDLIKIKTKDDLQNTNLVISYNFGYTKGILCGYLTSKNGMDMDKARACMQDFEKNLEKNELNDLTMLEFIVGYGSKLSTKSMIKNGFCKFQEKYSKTTKKQAKELFVNMKEAKEESYIKLQECLEDNNGMVTVIKYL